MRAAALDHPGPNARSSELFTIPPNGGYARRCSHYSHPHRDWTKRRGPCTAPCTSLTVFRGTPPCGIARDASDLRVPTTKSWPLTSVIRAGFVRATRRARNWLVVTTSLVTRSASRCGADGVRSDLCGRRPRRCPLRPRAMTKQAGARSVAEGYAVTGRGSTRGLAATRCPAS